MKILTRVLVSLGIFIFPGCSELYAQDHSDITFPLSTQMAELMRSPANISTRENRKVDSAYFLQTHSKNYKQNTDEKLNSGDLTPTGIFRFNNLNKTILIHPTNAIINSFWQKPWFIFSLLFLFLILTSLLIRWRIQSIKAFAREKLKVTQLKSEQLQMQLESEQILNYFSNSLIGKNSLDDVLWDVARNLIGQLGFVDCIIYLWNDDKTKMVQKAGFGPKGTRDRIGKEPFEVYPGQGLVGHVIQSKEPLLISDTSKDSRYRVDDMVRESEITIPIISDNEIIGVIDSEHPNKNFFTARHLQILSMIATLVAVKIKSIEAESILLSTQFEILSMNEQLSKAKLKALQSQMNPHFIFNCLNSIDALIQSDDKYHATVYLNKFAKLIRNILDSSKQDTVSISKDFETLKLYIALEQFRNDNKFTAEIQADEELLQDDYQIPPLIIQPFVENAILHGLRYRYGDGGKLSVKAQKKGAYLEYIIEDNGVGREGMHKQMKEYSSYGIDMSYDRVKLFNREEKASVQIADLFHKDKPSGTKVTIHLKIDEC
ncbi:MAG: histidine kinase [Ginsengibacter sp.]